MTDKPSTGSELILYQTEDGRTRIQCRFEDQTLWLTQAQMAELFQTSVQNTNLHLKAICEEGELAEAATIKSNLIVRQEGTRQFSAEAAREKAELEYERYHSRQDARPRAIDAEFDKVVKQLPQPDREKKKRQGKK